MSKNLSELSGRKGLRENLFEELGIAATATGTPSIEKMEQLADEFTMGKANVYGAASFYDFLRPENKGKKFISVMAAHTCLLLRNPHAGASNLISAASTHVMQPNVGLHY